MPGLIAALMTGVRSLMAHQTALQTTGHNIANANTPGYSRQIPILATTPPEGGMRDEMPAPWTLGTGVQVQEVRRARDVFVDRQIWIDKQTGGYWEELKRAFEQIEAYFPESEESGINKLLGDFFDAWHDLSLAPEDTTARVCVIRAADSLANAFNMAAQNLDDLRNSLDDSLDGAVTDINTITAEIAKMNCEIRVAELGGVAANDLRDKRDLLTDELANLINIQVTPEADNTYTITVGGDVLVQGSNAELMETVTGPGGFLEVRWVSSNPVTITNGKTAGLIHARDTVVPSYRTELDQLAAGIINAVNTQHALGYDLNGGAGGAFFTGTDAGTIAVSSTIEADTSLVAAASTPAPGVNCNSLAIAALAHQITMPNATFSGFYAAMLGRLGAESREAARTSENQELILRMLDDQRQEVCGVSLDEEMTNLIRFQRGYEAAARVVTTVDELLSLVVNRLGVGGR